MTSKAQEVLSQALALSDDERGALAARLFETLDQETAGDIETAWRKEIRRRIEELDSGLVEAIPWEQAKARLTGSKSG